MGTFNSRFQIATFPRQPENPPGDIELSQHGRSVREEIQPDTSLIAYQFQPLLEDITTLIDRIGYSRDQVGESLRSVHEQAKRLHSLIAQKLADDIGSLMCGPSADDYRRVLEEIRQNYQAQLIYTIHNADDIDRRPSAHRRSSGDREDS